MSATARRFLMPIALVFVLLAIPSATAHERYQSDDGSIIIVLGEQNEPVYTYDYTNLDLIVSDNATGDPITGVEETLEVTLIAPNNDELSLPLEAQHGTEGRYQFVQDYVLTMPGQYSARLEGTINGIDVSGDYLLPGPRGAFTEITFPHDDVPDLRELQQRNAALEEEIASLRADLEALQEDRGETGESPTPGLVTIAALAAAIAVARWRRSA